MTKEEEIKKVYADIINDLERKVIELKAIIAKEFNENDELGSEFVYVGILKEQLATAEQKAKDYRKALETVAFAKNIKSRQHYAMTQLKEIAEKHNG